MNVLYSELAKQLGNTQQCNKSMNMSVVKCKEKINELNRSECMMKSTKDTSFKNFNSSLMKGKNDIEGPEELHTFYVNIMQQNKGLAFKFENLNFEEIYNNILN